MNWRTLGRTRVAENSRATCRVWQARSGAWKAQVTWRSMNPTEVTGSLECARPSEKMAREAAEWLAGCFPSAPPLEPGGRSVLE